MGIYIKGMEMPGNCAVCPCSDDESRYCKAANKYIPMLGKPMFCPLFPAPEHGRLIDEKEVLTGCGYIIADGMACIPVKHIVNAPTIIPADKDGET